MYAYLAGMFMILKWETRIMGLNPGQHFLIFQMIGYALFAVLPRICLKQSS